MVEATVDRLRPQNFHLHRLQMLLKTAVDWQTQTPTATSPRGRSGRTDPASPALIAKGHFTDPGIVWKM